MELPNNDEMPNDHTSEWHFRWQEWLAQFGLSLEFDSKRIWRETYWIASVPSKNLESATHAIVMQGSRVAFDPSNKRRYRKGQNLIGEDIVDGGWWFEVADFSRLHKLNEYRNRSWLGTKEIQTKTICSSDDLKALVAENDSLKEQADGLKNAINSALRESADIREGIRTGQARDLVIIDNSFYVIEDGLQIALAHGGNDD